MITRFTNRYVERRTEAVKEFSKSHPRDYGDVLRRVLAVVADEEDGFDFPDVDRIHEIDDGDYQGSLVFVIAGYGYQPSRYWYTRVSYGSCSGCDTLEKIRDDGQYGSKPNDQQILDYVSLGMHLLQRMRVLM